MLPGIFAAIEAMEAAASQQEKIPGENTQSEARAADLPEDVVFEYKATRRHRRFQRVALGAVGLAAVVVIAAFGIQNMSSSSVNSIIEIDVNPSIELTAGEDERVIGARALNEEAKEVMGDMDLGGVDLDVAMNALIGSMLKHGYVSELKNSILVSLENVDENKAQTLEKKIAGDIESLLSSDGVSGAVLTQVVADSPELKALAEEHNISIGKAAFINKLLQSDPRLKFADLVSLSINDLNLLAEGRKTELQGLSTLGKAAPGEYIGEGKAIKIALSKAGVKAADVTQLEAVMEYEAGMMVYDVDFYYNGKEYEYEIDALAGQIVSSENETDDDMLGQHPDGGGSDQGKNSSQKQRISKESALKIALRHAGFSKSQVTYTHTSLETDDGRLEYSVEFVKDNIEYEYDIDAITGKIIEWDSDYHD
jgi:uncharacterized membrane protein YkoI